MNKKYKYIIIAFLIVASFIAFGRIAGNGFVNYDDEGYITKNQHIQSGFNPETIKWVFTSVVLSNWHPLTLLSHALDWQLFGADASGHHLVSLLWHIGSAIILFLFLSKTTGSLWPSAFVAALFALHPLRVESVAWAAERKDVLSMFFGMATIYTYACYVEKPKLSKYFLCLILFVLSLLSKPMLVTLPFVLLLLDYWPLERWQKALYPQNTPVIADNKASVKRKKHHKDNVPIENRLSLPVQSQGQLAINLLWEKLPFICLAIASSIVTIWAQQRGIATLEKLPLSDRIANAIVSYVAYLGKTFWPVDLAVLYPYDSSFALWQIFVAILFLLGMSAAVIYFVKKAPFLFVGWFWYLGTLVPVIGIVQVGIQSMADRYTYMPSIGIAIMLVWGFSYLLPKEKLSKMISIPAVFILLAGLTFLTWQQCCYWKNGSTLFSHALEVTQNNYLAHTNLGVALADGAKIDEAIIHYREAIKINPDACDAYYNLGLALRDKGKMEDALREFRETVRIRPSYADAHNNIGIILEMYYKKYDEAIYHYQSCLKIEPDNYGTHFNLGLTLIKNGKSKEAIEHFRQAINLKPDFEDARKALKLALAMERQKR